MKAPTSVRFQNNLLMCVVAFKPIEKIYLIRPVQRIAMNSRYNRAATNQTAERRDLQPLLLEMQVPYLSRAAVGFGQPGKAGLGRG